GRGASGRWRLGATSGGGILVDHGWHVFYLMRWLMGGLDPAAISAFMGVGQAAPVEDVADFRVIFPGDRIASAHLTWRSPVRRTRAKLYGSEAALEIDGDRVILTARSGMPEDVSPTPEDDDSYHSAWFAGVAGDFERAVYQSVGQSIGQCIGQTIEQSVENGIESAELAENLAEARAALTLTLGAQESSRQGGSLVKLV
ncbi:MAG: Gfo/Idh/MocA family oxidoreductase, partial [Candidatus Binataceae bacterium]